MSISSDFLFIIPTDTDTMSVKSKHNVSATQSAQFKWAKNLALTENAHYTILQLQE